MIFDRPQGPDRGFNYDMECKISVHYGQDGKPFIGARVRYPAQESSRIMLMHMSYGVTENLYKVFDSVNVFVLCTIDHWIPCDIYGTKDSIEMIGRAPKFIDRWGMYLSEEKWRK